MVDPNTNGDEPRLELTGGGSGARVVLAEADAPGSLHYLLEAEGFSVVGCAGDEDELGRVLAQDVHPDVVVLDADIVATASLVARELAPDAHVIAIWPDDVQPPPGGERVSPRMVYEELGPAIRRHMDRRAVPVPVIALPVDEPVLASVAAGAAVGGAVLTSTATSTGVFARTASRMSVLSVTLVTAILFTMGVSFALGGFRWSPSGGPPRVALPGVPDIGVAGTGDPATGRVPTGAGSHPSGNGSKNGSNGGNHHATGGLSGVVVTTTGATDGGGTPTDQTGDQSTGSGDQTGGSGENNGGNSGDNSGGNSGGNSGDHGGGGNSGDHGGGQGDHGGGGGDGQHGGGGGGGDDEGGDGQGGDGQGGDDQGEDQDGDGQGGNDQGDEQNSPSDHGSHGDHGDHGHGDDQGD